MTQAFNLSQLANNVNTSGLLNAAAGLYNQLPVANGGTGAATLAANSVLLGNGTSALQTVAFGASGNVLTSDGTTWVSQTASGGTPIVRIYTSPSPWTKPATLKAVKVTVLSGGGGGAGNNATAGGGGGGGAGGFGYFSAPAIPGPLTVTASGAPNPGSTAPSASPSNVAGTTGSTSSFGALITATGGAGGTTTGGSTGAFTSIPQGFGFTGTPGTTPPGTQGGGGGNAFQLWGFGAAPVTSPNVNGNSGTGYGAGGGGGYSAGSPQPRTGGAGTGGYVIVEEFY